jgi:hypothetical protein
MSQQEHLEWLFKGKLRVLPPPPQCTSIVSSKKRFTTRTLAGYSVLNVELVNLKLDHKRFYMHGHRNLKGCKFVIVKYEQNRT